MRSQRPLFQGGLYHFLWLQGPVLVPHHPRAPTSLHCTVQAHFWGSAFPSFLLFLSLLWAPQCLHIEVSYLIVDGGRTQSLLLHHDCGIEFFSYCGRIANTKDGGQEGRSDGGEKCSDVIYYEPILIILQPWTQNGKKKRKKEGRRERGRKKGGRKEFTSEQ